MAVIMKFVVLLLTLAIHDITCADPSNPQSHFGPPEATLNCKEDGFSVQVEFGTFNLSAAQTGFIILGTPAVEACTESDIPINGTEPTPVDFTLGGKTTIVYSTNGTATCDGTLTNTTTTLGYTNVLHIDVFEITGTIVRVYRYEFSLTCTLTRQQTEAGTPSFTVDSTLQLEKEAESKDGTFDLGVSLSFINDTGDVKGDFVVDNFEMLSLRIKEVPGNADYKFTVQRCYASSNSNASDTTLFDEFFVNECPTDNTVTFTPGGNDQSEFLFQLRAFYMAGRVSDAVYIHCELFVCRANEDISVYGGKCIQKTPSQCNHLRKRRSIVEKEKTRETMFVSTKNSFTIAVSGVRCPEGYVFDSSIDECTNQRLILVKGVYLGLEWNPAYANVTSPAFTQFARTTSFQLEALMRIANKEHVITGLKIVAARKGSVILDVLITYGESVNAVKAFQEFEEVVFGTTPQMTRIVNLLNIRQDKLIEYVQVTANNNKTNLEIILIVVIVAAVILIACISGITLYRVKQARQGNATPAPARVPNVFDNKAMESI